MDYFDKKVFMSHARVLYGKPLAEDVYHQLKPWVEWLTLALHRQPALDVVLVGDNPASHVYVERKRVQCLSLGIESRVHYLPADTPLDTLQSLINQLNNDNKVDGMLVQMPLPSHLDSLHVLGMVSAHKDVDGLNPTNLGALYVGTGHMLPCTPLGVMHILNHVWGDVCGKHIVIKGRSILVGRSLAAMLVNANATVTLMHSYSQHTRDIIQKADAIIMAVGRPRSLMAEEVKPGAVVIDVGISRLADGTLVGDVDAGVLSVAGALTPVPGGVGPMTIAALMANTVRAACSRLLLQGGINHDEFTLFKRTHPFPIGPDF